MTLTISRKNTANSSPHDRCLLKSQKFIVALIGLAFCLGVLVGSNLYSPVGGLRVSRTLATMTASIGTNEETKTKKSVFDSVQYTLPMQKDLMSNKLLKQHPLKVVECADKDNYILMHSTFAADWVCNNPGEQAVTAVMLHVFRSNDKSSSLMLDIGANAGYYGLLAARFGHSVVQFDLQPDCIHMIHDAVFVNNFADRVRIIHQGVNDKHSNITVPSSGCDGRFPMSAYERKTFGTHDTVVELHPLDHYLHDPEQEIMLMKVDTEGNEKRVLDGAISFFRNRQVRNAIVELTPGFGFWKNAGIEETSVIDTLAKIVDQHGYVMISLHNWQILRQRQEIADYVLTDASPGQFDVWLVRKEDVQEMGGTYDKNTLLN